MTTVETIRVGPDWLDLRERADAAARSRALVGQLRRRVLADGPLLVHDLGCGTGSMARWLAPLLPGMVPPPHPMLPGTDERDYYRGTAKASTAVVSTGATSGKVYDLGFD